MTPRLMTRRAFTRAEDEMIVANSRGLMSLHMIVNTLHCSSETLERRAGELGVKLIKKSQRGGSRPRSDRHKSYDPTEPSYASDGSNNAPHVGNDLLLKRLRKHHGGDPSPDASEGMNMKLLYRIVGMKYRDAELFVREQMKNGPAAITLEREPENQFDANAVKVILQDRHVGYVRRDQASDLAIEMDKGCVVGPARRSAKLIDDRGYPAAEITTGENP